MSYCNHLNSVIIMMMMKSARICCTGGGASMDKKNKNDSISIRFHPHKTSRGKTNVLLRIHRFGISPLVLRNTCNTHVIIKFRVSSPRQ